MVGIADTLVEEAQKMSTEKSGVINGIPWSETENRPELYAFARDLELPGIKSRSSKSDIVSALVKAQKKADKGSAVEEAPAPQAKLAAAPRVVTKAKRDSKKKVAAWTAVKKAEVKSSAAKPARTKRARDVGAEARAKKADRKARRRQGGRGRS